MDTVDTTKLTWFGNNRASLIARLIDDRPLRVIVLVSLIAVMSFVDLYLTILYLTHTGMNELNPLARAMMEYRSPMLLGVWKCSTVLIGVGILIYARSRKSAEIGALLGFFILGSLMIHWGRFVHEHDKIMSNPVLVEAMGDPTFIRFGDPVPDAGQIRMFGPARASVIDDQVIP